jgi:hypothetical protein
MASPFTSPHARPGLYPVAPPAPVFHPGAYPAPAPAPPPPPRRQSPILAFTISAVIVLTAAAAGAGTLVLTAPNPTAVRKVDTVWDPRVRFAVEFVEEHKGAPFKRAVPIQFMSETEFEGSFASTERVDKEERAEAEAMAAMLRALGLAQGTVDLLAPGSHAGVLAYYDPRVGRVRIRGTDLDQQTRATVVHELVHAWQDQHYNLFDVWKQDDAGAPEAAAVRRMLAEGDAENVEEVWVETLSDAEKEAVEAGRRALAAEAETKERTAGVPLAYAVSWQSSYLLGPRFLRGMETSEGGVDRVMKEPPTSVEAVIEPWSTRDGRPPQTLTPPPAPAGAVTMAENQAIGPLDLYLMLAERLEPRDAIAASDAWVADSVRLTRGSPERADAVCLQAAFTGHDAAGTTTLHRALTAWAKGVPWARVERGEHVTLTACDPGSSADYAVPDRALQAITLPVLRLELWAQQLERGATQEDAACVARTFTSGLTYAELDPSKDLTQRRKNQLFEAVSRTCKRVR